MRVRWELALPAAVAFAVLLLGMVRARTDDGVPPVPPQEAAAEDAASASRAVAGAPDPGFGLRVLSEEDGRTVRFYRYRAVRPDSFFVVADALDGEPGPSAVLRGDALRRANDLVDANALAPGQTILVPLQRGEGDLLVPVRSLLAALTLHGAVTPPQVLRPGPATLAAFEGRLALAEVSLDLSAESGPGYLLTFFRTDRVAFTTGGHMDAGAHYTEAAFAVAGGSLVNQLDPAVRYLWWDPATRYLHAVQAGPGSALGARDLAVLLASDSGMAAP